MPTPTQKVISSSLAEPPARRAVTVGNTAATAARNITPARTSAPRGLTWASTMVLHQTENSTPRTNKAWTSDS